jgi:trehalose 6-phosphate synthase
MTSAFWGQSFVAELTRISAQGEKKLKARRASLVRPSTQGSMAQTTEPVQMDKASKPASAEGVEGEHVNVPEQADPAVRSQTH